MDFIKKYTSHEEYEVNKTPNVSLCIEDNETKHLHYTKKRFDDEYLTFEALESGTFTLTIGSAVTTGDVVSVSYSTDNGETWTTTNNTYKQTITITTPKVNAGDEVLWKGNAVRMANAANSNSASTFSSTANFNARGNVMSLLYGDDFKGEVSLSGKDYCFCWLFYNNTKLTNGKNISLPATTLAQNCYNGMFRDCTSLTTASELPATALTNGCYSQMFNGCTSLTTAPELSAETLAQNCYNGMFRDCTSLTTAPELPATTLTHWCYMDMFNGCTSLTVAPALPATTLANNCYNGMFRDCTSLTTAPELPVTTLANGCYSAMFFGCTSLTVAPELPATTLVDNCYNAMFNGCTSLTTAPVLSATTLKSNCYSDMFRGCTNLTTAPELPATTLANGCYYQMFFGCTSLTVAPKLLATTLASQCYYRMFYGCASLTTAPELPATTLARYCYYDMFNGCTSLTTAPELPATTLAEYCYDGMFINCTSLTTAPVLSAATLTERCYYNMFKGCTSLNSITCLATDISATVCTWNWVSSVASSGTFIKADGMNDWTRGSDGIPRNWTVEDFYVKKYFATIAREDGTISFNLWKSMGTDMIKSISYSTDNGETWATTNNTDNKSEHLVITVDVNEGNKVLWKGDAQQLGYNDIVDYGDAVGSFFSSDCEFDVQGNVMSLLYGDDFKNKTMIENECAFAWLFSDYDEVKTCKVVNAKNLSLPATTLAHNCYNAMFYGCTSLTTAPHLPATTLTERCYYLMFNGCTSLTTTPELPAETLSRQCYQQMFLGCTSLTTAPELPATTLAYACYQNMFLGCTNLTTTPELPATTLASYCYMNMFNGCTKLTTATELSATTLAYGCYQRMFGGCTSLTTAPELPATTLTEDCYNGMFYGCTSLTTAPELSATTLVSWCYSQMFYGCTNLSSITCIATDISASRCTYNWVSNVAASGTFTKAPSMNSWTTGVNGIPTNWAVRDYSTISTSLVMYVDDFPETKLHEGGETVEEVMNRQLNSSNECNIGNKYVYTGGTITYNGNTYYLWEMSDDCSWDSEVVYLLTTTVDFNTLHGQSLEDALTNHFTSLVGRLDEDKDGMYSGDEIGSEHELYLVKLVNNNSVSLRIWVDDFPEDAGYDEGSAQDKMTVEVEDPEGEGANPYEYLGETIVYNGNTYYLWQAVEGYNIDNSMTRYFATTTIDFNTLYGQSLEDDLTNHFTDAIGMFDDSKGMYWAQSIGDDGELYLVKVEDLS